MAFFLTFFVLLLASSAVDATVEQVCKTAASQSPNVQFNSCVSSLKAAPGSATADNQGLAVIAGTLNVKQARAIKSKVGSLLKSTSDPKIKGCLLTCQESFDDAIDEANEGTTAAEKRQIDDAKAMFSAVMNAPSTCDDGFTELHLQSPLTKDGAGLLELSAIVLSILSNLH